MSREHKSLADEWVEAENSRTAAKLQNLEGKMLVAIESVHGDGRIVDEVTVSLVEIDATEPPESISEGEYRRLYPVAYYRRSWNGDPHKLDRLSDS